MRIFRQLALAFVALFGFGASAPAQQSLPTPQPQAQRAVAAEARPALWKIADDDTTIYLFGTIHALPSHIEWFDGALATAFEGSHELVTEIVEPPADEMQQVVLGTAMLPPGQSLRAMLSDSDRAAFEAGLKSLGLPVDGLDRFEPWYAAVTLSTIPLLRDGYTAEQGVETRIGTRAKALGRPHSALETPRYQLSLFDALPLDAQKRYLRDVIDSLPTLKAELDQIVVACSRGEVEKVAELMNSEAEDPALVEALLINRNRAWAQWIRGRLDKPGKVFVAVGAGHLAGLGSVQDQLDRLGITAARVQ
jgi:uncharacterized protein